MPSVSVGPSYSPSTSPQGVPDQICISYPSASLLPFSVFAFPLPFFNERPELPVEFTVQEKPRFIDGIKMFSILFSFFP